MFLVASLVGCGGVSDSPVRVTPPPTTDSLKATLNEVVATGELGSGGSAIGLDIEKIRASDPAKADALQKTFDELMSTADPAQRKAKAQEMLSKL
jgi:hypothetical protein